MRTLVFVGLLLASPAYAAYTGDPWTPLKEETQLKKLFVDYSNLKDPFSVQFRKVEVRAATGKKGITTWCGEVNAKNGIGAYGGWSRFVAMDGLGDEPSVRIVDEDSNDIGGMFLNLFCKGSAFGGND
jgi:hypothetical protein